MNHIAQLRELLNKFTQIEVADLLGITDRTIQNYFADEPTKPHQKTIRKIGEIYQKLIVNKESIESLQMEEHPMLFENKPRFIDKRRAKKNESTPFLVPLVPVKAQAGYVRAVDQQTYIDNLEKYALPPGVNPQGAVWRYWEIEGESMEPAFHSGDIILTSQVHQFDWENLRNFYLYVIVTSDEASEKLRQRVLFKRVFCKNSLEWVLVSENEVDNPQQLLPVEYVKEVWVFRRSIVSKAPPTKEFKIIV
jgi:phage repressor protein C with HTH and peptisase S24 domain